MIKMHTTSFLTICILLSQQSLSVLGIERRRIGPGIRTSCNNDNPCNGSQVCESDQCICPDYLESDDGGINMKSIGSLFVQVEYDNGESVLWQGSAYVLHGHKNLFCNSPLKYVESLHVDRDENFPDQTFGVCLSETSIRSTQSTHRKPCTQRPRESCPFCSYCNLNDPIYYVIYGEHKNEISVGSFNNCTENEECSGAQLCLNNRCLCPKGLPAVEPHTGKINKNYYTSAVEGTRVIVSWNSEEKFCELEKYSVCCAANCPYDLVCSKGFFCHVSIGSIVEGREGQQFGKCLNKIPPRFDDRSHSRSLFPDSSVCSCCKRLEITDSVGSLQHNSNYSFQLFLLVNFYVFYIK